jgi:hypothetical protein
MLLNEYEIEFMFRKIRNIRNLGNVHTRCPHIVMSRTDAQNGLDFPFKDSPFSPKGTFENLNLCYFPENFFPSGKNMVYPENFSVYSEKNFHI